MSENIIWWVLAIATIIGGFAAIDYFCNACIKKFSIFAYLFNKKSPPQDYLEEPEGQVSLDSPFYVERQHVESKCYETIVKSNALIHIKAPRQMGKSSLMVRILDKAQKQHYRDVNLSLREADNTTLAELDSLLQWLCASVTEKLGLLDKVDEYWQSKRLGSKPKCTSYFEKYLLTEITNPLVLGLDEVDLVFQNEKVAVDFLGMLRTWHEKGRNQQAWQNLRLVISHSQEVYIPLDMKESPFNVGIGIELAEFNLEQMQGLVQLHKLTLINEQVQQLRQLVGGHPYLVRVALYQMAKGYYSLDKLLRRAAYEDGPYSQHLHHHLINLKGHPKLITEIKTIIASDNPIPVRDIKDVFKLRSMGLVKIVDNQVMPLCDLYRRYFNERL